VGNLGAYQAVTTIMKQFGGPEKAAWKLVPPVLVAGYALLRPAEAGIKKLGVKIKEARADDHRARAGAGRLFTVTADGTDSQGLHLTSGMQYRLLQHDDGAVLVEVIGDSNNPYMLSGEFLRTISDYPANESETARNQRRRASAPLSSRVSGLRVDQESKDAWL